ncbi:hypothetical protein I4F81_008855 [Pyropia yezoensis]|uniref:Uncharacterized protein n=1 Tax=Pyropia yezoensis TaxID=2788 RepID=A0ACC3C8A0_PYRYE|nr:hypothetical protein I4F81_008855 [Neopyropia yezoensis]
MLGEQTCLPEMSDTVDLAVRGSGDEPSARAAVMPMASLQYGAAGLSFSAGGTVAGSARNEWGGLGQGSAPDGLAMDHGRAQVISGGTAYMNARVGNSTAGHSSASGGARPITTIEALGIASLTGFKALDTKMAKMQTTVDHVSSLVSSEMAKTNNFAVLAEKVTAAQSATTTMVTELVAAREAAAAAVSAAPASALSEKEISDEQHAQDRIAAKAIKVSCACFLFVWFVLVPLALRANTRGAVYGGSLTLALNLLELL